MKNKYILSLLLGTLLVGLGTWGQLQGGSSQKISEEGLNELFHQVMYHIENDYVEDTDKQKLWFGAIRGMLKSLSDEHTRFLSPEEFNELNESIGGRFGGLGIEITIRDEILTVVSPIEDTPAMRVGIKPGDKIVEINKKSTKEMSLIEAVKLMRGTPGTSINISIAREGEDELLNFNIVRDIIKITIVQSKIIENEKIGYVRLKQFAKSSYRDVVNAVKKFKKAKVKGIIFDLRYNAGGLLNAAHKVANIFLNKGIIVSTKGRKSNLDRIYHANAQLTVDHKTPLIILVNEGSASASEIVTGAIKDNKRGKILGVKTFGKGSVQNVIRLGYNTGIALTIQKYYTPLGQSIHEKGIDPDIKVKPLEFTKYDRRRYREIKENKLVEKFVKKNPNYNKRNIKKFKRLLKKQGMNLSDFAARQTLKQVINKEKPKKDIIDLEFDVQLQKAISLLKK